MFSYIGEKRVWGQINMATSDGSREETRVCTEGGGVSRGARTEDHSPSWAWWVISLHVYAFDSFINAVV